MLLDSDKRIETCREAYHSGLRSEQIYGYVGKVRKSGSFVFHVTNRRHYFRTTRDMQGGNLPICVYAYGKVSGFSDSVKVKVNFWYGLTVLELLLLYVISFGCLYALSIRYQGISLSLMALCALGWTVFVELLSLACSAFTMLGNDDRKELENFLSRSLEPEEQSF